jgi:dTDP-4-dehydrorhamnose reductase
MLEASGDDGQGVPGGNYHLTDGGDCTWHGFTVEIAKRCGHDCDIEPCTSDAFRGPPPDRPTPCWTSAKARPSSDRSTTGEFPR